VNDIIIVCGNKIATQQIVVIINAASKVKTGKTEVK
jgi:hypothetical protein